MTDQAQLGLFGVPTEEGLAGELPAAPLMNLPPALQDAPLYLGTSSWNFAGWAGLVYPDGIRQEQLRKHGLKLYARHPLLKAAGIDRSYYAPLSTSQFAQYAKQVPDDFLFVVKACREIATPREQLPRSALRPTLSASIMRRMASSRWRWRPTAI